MKKVLWTFLITLIIAIVALFALGLIRLPNSWTAKYCTNAVVSGDYDEAIEDITDAIQSLNQTTDKLKDNDETLADAIKDLQESLEDIDMNPTTNDVDDQDDTTNNEQLEDASQAADEVDNS